MSSFPHQEAAPDDEAPLPAKRNGAMIGAILAVLAVAAGAVIWLATAGETDADVTSATTADGQAGGSPASADAVAGGGAGQAGGVAGAVGGDASVAPLGAGEAAQNAKPGAVQVEIVSEPPGARVEVGGIDKGVAPLSIAVAGEESVTVALRLEGYADKEVAIDSKTGPQARVIMRKIEAAEAKTGEIKAGDGKGGKPGAKTGGKVSGTKTNGSKASSSALEERL